MHFSVELIRRVEPDVSGVVDAVQLEGEIVIALRGVDGHLGRELLENGPEHGVRVLDVEIVRPEEIVDDFLVGVQLQLPRRRSAGQKRGDNCGCGVDGKRPPERFQASRHVHFGPFISSATNGNSDAFWKCHAAPQPTEK